MIGNASPEVILQLAATMRRKDVGEAKLLLGIDHRKALIRAYNHSTESRFFQHNDKIYCAFGIILPHTLWMVFGGDFERLPREFFRESKKTTKHFLEKYSFIENYTLADNDFIIKWVEWLDGTVGPVELLNNVPIRRWRICAMK